MKALLLTAMLFLAGCSTTINEPPTVLYGEVVSVRSYQVTEQQPNLTGALVGGVAGGVVGNQFGKGNGKKAMTVVGAVAGAAVGSQVGQTQQTRSHTDLSVRMPDNTVISITTADVGFRVGQAVKISQRGKQATIEAIN